MAIIWAIALAKLIFHIYFNNRYGYFRDEFDYMSCGEHLQWGYVDQPPLIPFLIHVSRAVLGDSLRAIRFIPALSSALLVVQAAAIARELGGRTYALILTAICVAVAPQYLSNGGLLGTNDLEPILWMGCAYFAILAIKRDDPRYWVWFGVSAGLGLEEKYTIAIFCAGIVIGLLLTAQRRVFLNIWIWLCGAVAFLIFLPNILWNWHYGWPFLQLIRAIRAEGRDVVLGPGAWFFQQVLVVSPFAAPIWLAGLFALLFWPKLRPFRFLGWSYLVAYLAIFLQHGKNYYLAPIYPMLFAAGATCLESALDQPESGKPRLQWVKRVVATVVLISGLYMAPITVPMLSPEHFLAYTKMLPFKLPANEYSHMRVALPQWYSDQFGWKEIADAAVVAWNRLTPEERGSDPNKACAIFAQDYGQAGAIDFFDRKLGLPPAISGDRTYWLWGPHGYSGNCMIILDDRPERLHELFDEVEHVGRSADNPWALEKQVTVDICRKPKFGTLSRAWPHIKRWR